MSIAPYPFYEFFAGGGMARLGLGAPWHCTFANEWDPKKATVYQSNFEQSEQLTVKDIHTIDSDALPGKAALAWASFPCQDLSLAGGGGGLTAHRSGAFFGFWKLIPALIAEERAPPIIVLENVIGLLSSNKGQDFQALLEMVTKAGYHVGAVIGDAALFLPQSRPRLFILAVKQVPDRLKRKHPSAQWSSARLVKSVEALPQHLQKKWIWFDVPELDRGNALPLSSVMMVQPEDVPWHSVAETEALIAMMSPRTEEKLRDLLGKNKPCFATAYRRGRPDDTGRIRQRVELRIDGIAGCLRTPAGGSSRQIVFLINGVDTDRPVRTRLLSAREGARLMGLSDTYALPDRYNEAYHLIGDGVAVPVVRHLSESLLEPLAHTNF